MVVGCLPGGDKLLGIGEPAPGDRTDGGVGGADNGDGRDVAMAVGDGVQIRSGNRAGAFSRGMKIVHGDADVVVRDEDGATLAAIRQSARAA